MTSSLILLSALFLAVLLSSVYTVHIFIQLVRLHRGEVPFVQSDTRIVRRVLDEGLLPERGMVLDLGCGDGTLLFALERRGHAGPLIGYEHSLHPWASGALWAWLTRSRVRVLHRDARDAPLQDASAVYVFLLENALEELRPLFESSLTPGTVLVSAEFAVPGWRPVRTVFCHGVTSKQAPIYVYRAGESFHREAGSGKRQAESSDVASWDGSVGS